MPAIRHYHHCINQVATHVPAKTAVGVRMASGSYVRLPWLGFVCEFAMDALNHSGRVKIAANAISRDMAFLPDHWRELEKSDHVLGIRVQFGARAQVKDGIYGVVDADCWPIVIRCLGMVKKPKLKISNA